MSLHDADSAPHLVTCAHCGTSNIPERRTCKRCRRRLRVTARDQALAQQQRRTGRIGLIRELLLTIIGASVFFGLVALLSMNEVPRPGSSIYMRYSGSALLRQVTQPPYEGLEIDGSNVRHFPYPITRDRLPAMQPMLSQEQDAYNRFYAAWCAQLPAFRPVQPGEPFYELGVKCGRDIKQAAIPVDQLPPVFAALRERVRISNR